MLSSTLPKPGRYWREGQLRRPPWIVWTWPNPDPATLGPCTVSVSRDRAGRWFVVLHVDVRDPDPMPATGQSVGVDLDLLDSPVLSNGERTAHPKQMARREGRLKRYQCILARKRRGSANRVKATVLVTGQHAKVSDARRDFPHQRSTDLVRRFDGIAVEDMAVRNMVKSRKLSKAIRRTGWGEFRALLTYKAERQRCTLVVVAAKNIKNAAGFAVSA